MTQKFTPYTWFLFIALSIVGVFLFITPINTEEGLKVPIALLANALSAQVSSFIHWFASRAGHIHVCTCRRLLFGHHSHHLYADLRYYAKGLG